MTKRTQGHIESRMRHSRHPKSEIPLSWYRIMPMKKAPNSARLLSTFLVIAALCSAAAQTPEQVREKRLQWWWEARFGMFIQLGPLRGSGRGGESQTDRRDRRVDHEPRENPRRRIRATCQAIQPSEVQRGRVGAVEFLLAKN